VKIDRERLKRVLGETRKIALAPAIAWVVYLAVAEIFTAATGSRGLVSPDDPNLGLLALGAATLGLRTVAIFVLPAVLVYRLSARLLGSRRTDPPRSRPTPGSARPGPRRAGAGCGRC
jgi:hypothetical protein